MKEMYTKLVRLLEKMQSPLILIMRLYWGWGFFQAGKGKLGNIDQVAGFFGTLGIPLPILNAYLVATVEAIGGLLILFGLGSRLAAIPLTVVMIVAYLTAHLDALGNIFSDPKTFTEQAPFLFLIMLFVVLAFGPGKISLDHWFKKKKEAV